MLKRMISLILCLAIFLSIIPVQVLASDVVTSANGSIVGAISDCTDSDTASFSANSVDSFKEQSSSADTSAADNLVSAPVPSAVTASGTCGENVTWSLSSGRLVISGTGPMAEYSTDSKVPWNAYRSSITSAEIEYGVTSICEYALDDCFYLTSASIADSVTDIRLNAFRECGNLTDVYYSGAEEQWNAIYIDSSNTPLTDATIHYNSTGPDDHENSKNEAIVRYFHSWDAENQIAYFDSDPSENPANLGSQVTEETDTSFLENVDELVGKYVLVESKARDDGMIAPDTLISITYTDTRTEFSTVKLPTYETVELDFGKIPVEYTNELLVSLGPPRSTHDYLHGYSGNTEMLYLSNGTLRLAVYWNQHLYINDYSSDFTLLDSLDIPLNVATWCGICLSAEASFAFYGQSNAEDDTTVYYVTEFDSEFKEVATLSLNDHTSWEWKFSKYCNIAMGLRNNILTLFTARNNSSGYNYYAYSIEIDVQKMGDPDASDVVTLWWRATHASNPRRVLLGFDGDEPIFAVDSFDDFPGGIFISAGKEYRNCICFSANRDFLLAFGDLLCPIFLLFPYAAT